MAKDHSNASGGFTLIEVVIALALMGIIVVALGEALDVGLRSSGSASLRVSESQDEQQSARWFSSDVAQLSSAPSVASSNTVCASGMLPTTIVGLPQIGGAVTTWTLRPTPLSGGEAAPTPLVCQLVRQVGASAATSLVVASNVVQVDKVTCTAGSAPDVSCDSKTTSISTKVTEAADPRDTNAANQLVFYLTGGVRMFLASTGGGGGSPPPPQPGPVPTLLTLGTDCSNSGVTLKGGGNSGVLFSQNGTAVVDTCVSEKGNHDNISAQTLYVPSGDCACNSKQSSTNLDYPVNDPYLGLSAPTATGPTYAAGSTFQGPGTYLGAVTIPNNVVMPDGIYVFDGDVTFGGSVKNSSGGVPNVLLYLSCTSCTVNFASTTTLNPPTSGAYSGMVLFQGRSDSQALQLGGETLNGIVYLPDSGVSDSGSPASTATFKSLIALYVTFKGNANLTLTGSS